MRFWLPALVAMAVLPAGAHHPFTPYYDASKPASITGEIVELRTVSGWVARDPQARAFTGGTVTFADGTTMLFGILNPGTGEDRWKCLSDPCPQYSYPDVQ